MKTATIPLAGSILTRHSAYDGRDQKFTNCFSDEAQDAMTGGKRIYTQKRLGFSGATVTGVTHGDGGACIWQSLSTGAVSALPFFKTATTMQIFNGVTSTQIGGDLANTDVCHGLCDAVVSGVANLAGSFRSTAGAAPLEGWYFPEGGAWTKITDTDFPPAQTPAIALAPYSAPVQMDGYLFWLCANGQIWNSDLNSLSAYTANNKIDAQSMPDAGVALARMKDNLVAFGAYSIEFFRNAGNPSGSPLASVPGSVVRIGVRSGCKIATIGNSIYFQGINAETGDRSIYKLSGGQLSKISTIGVDRLMTDNTYWSCIGSIKQYGMEHVLFNAAGTTTYAFCTNNNRWWVFSGANGEVFSAALSIGSESVSLLASNTAKIYNMQTNAAGYQDDSTNLTMTIQTMPIDMGTDKKKFASKLRLVGDKQSSTCNVAVSWSDDDAITFSTPINIDMSSANPYITRLGSFVRRVFKFTNAVNLPCRLESFVLDYTIGTS